MAYITAVDSSAEFLDVHLGKIKKLIAPEEWDDNALGALAMNIYRL